jgi:hypothetical protein
VHQPTWGYFLAAACLAHLLAVMLAIRQLTQDFEKGAIVRTACAALLLGQLGYDIEGVMNESRIVRQGRYNPPELVEGALFREVALNLSLLDPNTPPVFMSPPTLGPKLAWFGRGSVIGSQYENLAGIGAAMDFFSDTGDLAVARELARRRKLDFVIIVAGDLFIRTSMRVPKQRQPGAAGLTLAERLNLPQPDVPEWLEPIPWPNLFPGHGSELRIYLVKH